jgi:hypothetical protein
MVLGQLGLFCEPDRALGSITTALMHPLTMARIAGRVLKRWHREKTDASRGQ